MPLFVGNGRAPYKLFWEYVTSNMKPSRVVSLDPLTTAGTTVVAGPGIAVS